MGVFTNYQIFFLLAEFTVLKCWFGSQPYLHESRHQHAMRRARGTGGRFAKKTKGESSNGGGDEKERGERAHMSCSEESNEAWDSSGRKGCGSGNGCFTSERAEEGDCSAHQRERLTAHRRLAIQ